MPTFEDEDDDDEAPVERPAARPQRRELPPMPSPEERGAIPEGVIPEDGVGPARPITPPFQGSFQGAGTVGDVAAAFDPSHNANQDRVMAERFSRASGSSRRGQVLQFPQGGRPGRPSGHGPGQGHSMGETASGDPAGQPPATTTPAGPVPGATPPATTPAPQVPTSDQAAMPWWMEWAPVIAGAALLIAGWWFSSRRQKEIGDLADEWGTPSSEDEEGEEDEAA